MLLPFAERHVREYLSGHGKATPPGTESIACLVFDRHGILTPDEFAQMEPPPPFDLLREVWTYPQLFTA